MSATATRRTYLRIYSADVCPSQPNDADCEVASITVVMDESEAMHPEHPASLAEAYIAVNAHGWMIVDRLTFHGTEEA